MRKIVQSLGMRPGPELFFQAWIATTIVLAAYILSVSAFVDDISAALWLIGAPIALTKAALIVSGLGFLVWLVALRRPDHN